MILSFQEKTYINFTHQQSKTGRAPGPENIFPALPGHSPDLPNNLPQSKLITLRLFHFYIYMQYAVINYSPDSA